MTLADGRYAACRTRGWRSKRLVQSALKGEDGRLYEPIGAPNRYVYLTVHGIRRLSDDSATAEHVFKFSELYV